MALILPEAIATAQAARGYHHAVAGPNQLAVDDLGPDSANVEVSRWDWRA